VLCKYVLNILYISWIYPTKSS